MDVEKGKRKAMMGEEETAKTMIGKTGAIVRVKRTRHRNKYIISALDPH
jgi:hypothetical protein